MDRFDNRGRLLRWITATLAITLVLGSGLALEVRGEPAATADSGSDARWFTLRSTEAGGVTVDWDRAAIRAKSDRGEAFRIAAFPLRSDLEVDLRVEPFSIVGPDTRFVEGHFGQPDAPIDFDPSSIVFLRGEAVGHPGSRVFLALTDGLSTGYVDLGPGARRYRIASSSDVAGGLTVFRAMGAPTLPGGVDLCGVEDHGAQPTGAAGPALLPPGFFPGLKHIELAVETDHEFFQLFGNSVDAATYLTMLYAEISEIFVRDVDSRFELVFTRVWPMDDDPFNGPDPLPEFRAYWEDNMDGVDRDVAQMFSGRRDYPFGGQAWLDAVCGSFAYSVTGYALGFFPDPSMPSPYSYDIFVTAHELGHNFGALHTHSLGIDECDDPFTTPQRGPIMSYCSQTWSGMNANGDLYFHGESQAFMDNILTAVSCVVQDCNQNNVDDAIDVQGASDDVNSNNVPDECEDCNENSVLDPTDIANATSLDLNDNAIPDECEPDCNNNDVPDDKDIADGTSFDAYRNDIPDECEADCNGNGTSDYTEIQMNMPLDVDRNAVLDSCQDCDDDLTTDFVELAAAHNVWVASGLADSELRQVFATTGVLTQVSSGGAGSAVEEGMDLIITPNGRVLVTSMMDHRVMEFDLDGVYQGDLVSPSSGGLDSPAGLVLTPDEQFLLVASRNTDRVIAYDAVDGTPLGDFVAAGAGGLTLPFGMVYGPNGNMFVSSGDHEVLEFDGLDGSFVRVFVDQADNGGLDQPRGMTFKPDGNLLVASYGTDEVLEYDGATGASLGKWAQVGTASVLTQTSPWGVRVAPNGNVFVARTGEDYGGSGGGHDHGDDHVDSQGALHLSNAQMYEYDATNGLFLRTHIGGNDHGMVFPTGFDFVPGWEQDCNVNLIPDECEIGSLPQGPEDCAADCNGNGRQDRLDIIPYGVEQDCNGNLSPDECDLLSISSDCDANGVPDECEATSCASCFEDGDCDDGLACTVQTCDAGQCDAELVEGQCLIAGVCYGDGTSNPGNSCQLCDAQSPHGWSAAVVAPVGTLTLDHEGTTQLSWPVPGGGSVVDIAGGDLSTLRASGGVLGAGCLDNDAVAGSWNDPRADPPSGDGYYYLARAQSTCGSGDYGPDSEGTLRRLIAACP